MDDKVYAIALTLVAGIGPVNYQRLVARFGSARKVFEADFRKISQVEGVGEKLAGRIKSFKSFEEAEEDLKRARSKGVYIVSLEDDNYPVNLRNIPSPPPFIYVKGSLKKEDERAVAMVGTRRASNLGRLNAERIAFDLARHGITVVSGMAKGIDTCCHRGALSAGGRTIGVLGCGLDHIYPMENRSLYDDIASNGALLSEFPLGTPPYAQNFPRRNRIISGLALGVVIVEAPARSGALITAHLALDQGREVFAVPGSPGIVTSQGCNQLIKMGAKLVETAEDIISEILPQLPRAPKPQPKPERALSHDEEKILKLLSQEPCHVDAIAERTGLPTPKVLSLLTQMELNRLIRQLPGMVFVREDRV